MGIKYPKCHFDNPDTTRVCGECGAPIHPSEEIHISPTKIIQKPSGELSIGSTFAGKYKITQELGRGGMGKVYSLEDKRMEEGDSKMVTRICIIAVLLGALVLLVACSSSKEFKLDADDNGRQIELEKGQILVITLEANPTTGYIWEIAKHEQHVLRQVGEAGFEPESEAIGAQGIQTLRFEAVNVGKTALKLVYRRPWEEDVEPLETFSIKVVVR